MKALFAGLKSKYAPAQHSHDEATTTAAGMMSAADKAKLDGIDQSSSVEVDDETIKTNSDGELYVHSVPGTSVGIDGSTIKTNASGNLYADVPSVEVDDDTIKINGQGKIYVALPDLDSVSY